MTDRTLTTSHCFRLPITLALNCMQANLSLTESQTEQLKVVLDLLLEYGWEPEYYVFDVLDLPYEQLWY